MTKTCGTCRWWGTGSELEEGRDTRLCISDWAVHPIDGEACTEYKPRKTEETNEETKQ